MTLLEVIGRLNSLDEGLYLYIEAGKWSPESQVILIPMELLENGETKPPDGMEYFLEVEIAKEVIIAWRYSRADAIPTLQAMVEAVLYYAENDAYLPVR